MSAIKKFFQKKKLDVKFKKAGGGHRLNDEHNNSKSGGASTSQYRPTPRSGPSEEAQMAAVAAEARTQSRNQTGRIFSSS